MYNAGLILEGGGMKGIYTTGVLDFFIEKNIEFQSVYGVSAGACAMTSYISHQPGRGKDVMVDYLGEKRYLGLYSLFTTGNIFGVDMSYDLVPNYLNPLDYATYNKYEGKAYAVVTNIKTGEAEYHQIKDVQKDVKSIIASSSLPLVSKTVKMNGECYLDGGIADSIPIRKSEADGNNKNVVIMTKHEGYRKEAESKQSLSAIRARYLKYPKMYELMKNRADSYNEVLDYIEAKEKDGSIFLIRPKEDLNIGRMEKDKDKLLKLYEAGYEDAKASYESLISYLTK